MKKKQEQAMALLDAMDQVDAALLVQATETDTPEKFRALPHKQASKGHREKPVTPWRRWAAVATCLIVAISLAVSPWFFSSLLSKLTRPTQPIQSSPQTSNPTDPPTSTVSPVAKVHLNSSMNIWFHGNIHLECFYYSNADVYDVGDTITITLQITNVGAAFSCSETNDNLSFPALLRANTNMEYTIEPITQTVHNSEKAREMLHLAELSITYQFIIPEDAPQDHYTLETTLFGNQIIFNEKSTLRPPYVPCLADLPEEAQKIIARSNYGSELYSTLSPSIPVYGEFGDTYVVYYPAFGSEIITYETVNGLTFKYPSSHPIQVFTPEHIYSLTEAFEVGLLTSEQVKQIHERWLLVGVIILKRQYDPHILLETSVQLNYWGETRWGYAYEATPGRYYYGETIKIKVDLINHGPESTYDNIKNEIGSTAWLISDQTGFILESVEYNNDNLKNPSKCPTGGRVHIYFTFKVPNNFDEGKYTFIFTVGGKEIRFDNQALDEQRNISIIANMDHYGKTLVFGKDYLHDPEYIKNKHMPVYGEFTGQYNEQWYHAFVYIYPSDSSNERPIIETINGLVFEVPAGYQLHVFSVELGAFTLSEAFDTGILSAEQLQEVYDNFIFLQNSSESINP